MGYSYDIIETILRSAGITCGHQAALAQNSKGKVVYFCSHDVFTTTGVVNDILGFLATGLFSKPHKVCYLISDTPQQWTALVLDFPAPDDKLAKQLREEGRKPNITDYCAYFLSLYSHVMCTVFSTDKHIAYAAALNFLRRLFKLAQISINLVDRQQNPDVVFTEQVLAHLLGEATPQAILLE